MSLERLGQARAVNGTQNAHESSAVFVTIASVLRDTIKADRFPLSPRIVSLPAPSSIGVP